MRPLERLLNRLSNLGGPLSREHRENVRTAVLKPSEERWELIYEVLITPRHTVWQAVKAVDPKCPKALAPSRRWRGYYPDSFTLRRALEKAVSHE